MCLPLAGYDDSKPNTVNSDQQKLCITQGFWRTCLACKANPSESHTSRSVEADSRKCRKCQGFCGLSCDQSYFTEGAAKCNSCRLWESLQWGMCTECNSIKKYSLMVGLALLNRQACAIVVHHSCSWSRVQYVGASDRQRISKEQSQRCDNSTIVDATIADDVPFAAFSTRTRDPW